jgi:hypothetical protein
MVQVGRASLPLMSAQYQDLIAPLATHLRDLYHPHLRRRTHFFDYFGTDHRGHRILALIFLMALVPAIAARRAVGSFTMRMKLGPRKYCEQRVGATSQSWLRDNATAGCSAHSSYVRNGRIATL